jgi:hypothetical protein
MVVSVVAMAASEMVESVGDGSGAESNNGRLWIRGKRLGPQSIEAVVSVSRRREGGERKRNGGAGERIVRAPRGGVNRCYSNFNSFSI